MACGLRDKLMTGHMSSLAGEITGLVRVGR
jgi:hypothetical protein